MMIFEKFIDADLGHISYLVACDQTKDAFIVDPRRDIADYVDLIQRYALNLKYVFNTHTHADYIGGHLELAHKYNIQNIFHNTVPIKNYNMTKVWEGDCFQVGSLKVTIIETPGHTPFDITLLVSENDIQTLLFTGDILFIGEIGRPDLLGKESIELLAGNSYVSSNKLWKMGDEIVVLPSHIQGSLCGKNLSKHFFSTIGIEKKANKSFILCQESKEKYLMNLIGQKIETPAFFKKMALKNIEGPTLIDNLCQRVDKINFNKLDMNVQIVDIRHPKEFNKGHIQNAINIYENSNVSLIAGSVLDYEKDIYLIGNSESNFDLFMLKLFRVGLDNIKGIIIDTFEELANSLVVSQSIVRDKIDKNFINIVLDEGCCSELGEIIQSNITDFKELDISKFEKVIISCRQGYKSSAISSCYPGKNIYVIE